MLRAPFVLAHTLRASTHRYSFRAFRACVLAMAESGTAPTPVAAPGGSATVGEMRRLVAISSNFDAGNADVVGLDVGAGTVRARLRIRKEPFTEGTDKKHHSQWFYFRAANVQGLDCRFAFEDVNSASFPEAWPGTWAVASYDRQSWFRVKTTYDAEASNGTLALHLTPEHPIVYLAYFAPYSLERHHDLVARCQVAVDTDGKPLARVETLGMSLDGRGIDCVTVGTGPRVIWLVGRQHPGESMAEWCLEGLLERLVDARDAQARRMRTEATVHVVPNMNPDGSFRGHLRTNAAGANLNREWGNTGEYEAPTLERSPEVYCVLQRLKITGCDLFVDVHGDESLPHIFFAGTQGAPVWNDRLAELWRLFTDAQLRASPDFQVGHGYDNELPGEANLAICAEAVAQRFDCLSVTLEMPFKDTFGSTMPAEGWSPPRAKCFGASMLDAMASVLPFVRAPFPFGHGGIGDGREPAPWNQHGYKNPPSEHVYDTTP